MASTTTDVELDIFGAKLGMNIYTQLTWCFSITGKPDQERYVDVIQRGLARLSAAVPWITGSVLVEGAHDGLPGTAKIRLPISSSQDGNPHATVRLVVSRFEEDSELAMEKLIDHGFPMTMLHEDKLAPCRTLPQPDDESAKAQTEAEWLVFLLQMTFVRGGVLLTFVGHHAAMDMTCQGELIRLLDKACRDESFSEHELEIVNCDRANLIPTIQNDMDTKAVLKDQLIEASIPKTEDGATEVKKEAANPATCSWQYFNFKASALEAIKKLASEGITGEGAYISTDDALTSFIWQSITRIRSTHLPLKQASTSLARAVDARRYLNLDSATPGLIQDMTYHTFPITSLLNQPLSTTALSLRKAVDPSTSDIALRTKALATHLSRRSPSQKNDISFTANLDFEKDLALSSWTKVKGYDFEFGLGLGRPVAVRRPAFTPVEGLIYFMPRDDEGGIAVAICVKDGELEGLKSDERWKEFAEFG